MQYSQETHVLESLFNKVAILLKRDSHTGVFLWKLRNFYKHLFWKVQTATFSFLFNISIIRSCSQFIRVFLNLLQDLIIKWQWLPSQLLSLETKSTKTYLLVRTGKHHPFWTLKLYDLIQLLFGNIGLPKGNKTTVSNWQLF